MTKERLDTHIAFKHDRSKLFQCSFCSKMYRSKPTLESHVDFVHKKTGGHFCSHCGKAVQTIGELNRHIATAHEGVTYDCHLCGKCYKTKQGMY